MKRITLATLMLVASIARAGDPQTDLNALTKKYLDGLFAAKPHLATFMGDHRHDGRLPDISRAGTARREAELAGFQKTIAETQASWPKVIPQDVAIDVRIMKDAVALELLYLREIRDWTWDPRLNDSFPYYDPREIFAGRLSDIIHGDFAPRADRLASVRSELEALPIFLADKKAALTDKAAHKIPAVYMEQGITGATGTVEFLESDVKQFVSGDAGAEQARKKAVEATLAYKELLQRIAPTATGDWRLGAALYAKKFPLALQTDLTPAQVIPLAKANFDKAKGELLTVALRLHKQLWPQEPAPIFADLSQNTAARQQLIERVKNELSKDHPKPEELVAAHARNLDKLRAFITDHKLLELPPRETLTVEPMPAFKRGSSAAEYLAPGVLQHAATWHATYYVDPIDPTWDKARVESYLRGQNNYEVELVAAHEAYPGHHTQYSYERKTLNPLRAVLWNAPMVEGWAVYGEGLLVSLGYGGDKNDRFKFFDLRGQMIVATNILIDIQLQSGQMTDAEAVRFMVEEGFQERAMAEKKLVRAKLDSTQLAQYFLGYSEINALKADFMKRQGKQAASAATILRQFNEGLIGHGSIAVKFLREYLLR